MAEPTIKQVKEAKIKLEQNIMEMINNYEKEYGVKICYIRLDRVRSEPRPFDMAYEKEGPVRNVNADLELDFVED